MESDLFVTKGLGRLAYLSIPIPDFYSLEKSINFYQDNFKTREDVYNKDPQKAHSFKVVDVERFVEDTTTFFWLGNGSRKKTTTVCFRHKMEFKRESEAENLQILEQRMEKKLNSQSLFLGLCFNVSSIPNVISILQQHHAISNARLQIQNVPSLPRFLYFFDPSNIPIEITDKVVTSELPLNSPLRQGSGHTTPGRSTPSVRPSRPTSTRSRPAAVKTNPLHSNHPNNHPNKHNRGDNKHINNSSNSSNPPAIGSGLLPPTPGRKRASSHTRNNHNNPGGTGERGEGSGLSLPPVIGASSPGASTLTTPRSPRITQKHT